MPQAAKPGGTEQATSASQPLAQRPPLHTLPAFSEGPSGRFATQTTGALPSLAPTQGPPGMWQASQALCQGRLGPVRPVAWGPRLPGQDRGPVGARGCPTAAGPPHDGSMHAPKPPICPVWAGTQHRPRLPGPDPRVLLLRCPQCCLGNFVSHLSQRLVHLGRPVPHGPQVPPGQPVCRGRHGNEGSRCWAQAQQGSSLHSPEPV